MQAQGPRPNHLTYHLSANVEHISARGAASKECLTVAKDVLEVFRETWAGDT